MSDHVRERLRDEMAGSHRPPVDGLVTAAVQRGRRQRRTRTVVSAAGTTAVVGVTVLAVGIGAALPQHRAGRADLQAGAPAPVVAAAPTTAAANSTAPAPAPVATSAPAVTTSAAAVVNDGKDHKLAAAHEWRALQQAASRAHPPHWTNAPSGVAVTPQAELQLFSELAAPFGTTSHLGVSDDADTTHVRTYLTTPKGPGMLQWSMYHDTLGYEADCLPKPAAYLAKYSDVGPDKVTCHHTEDGGYAFESKFTGGCLEAADLTVVHPDGTAIWVNLATCVSSGTNELTPAPQPLTVAQAEQIFADPGFDFTVPADLVERSAAIGALPTFW